MTALDLRSDTVTQPTPGMRDAMARAEVGDDVYGEDPSVHRLEARVAELLGKERALFVPSGTMSNQLALLVQTRRGDEVVIGENAHCALYESGGGAAWSGVQFAVAGRGGLFDAKELVAAIKPPHYYLPRTRLVAIENTHNVGGGAVFPQARVVAIAEEARKRGLGLHLDGARLWNAHVASGRSLEELARPFDTVSVCFSKGLGAPVGSALVGSRDLLEEAHRYRKMLGGGMRQAGILAAAASYALDHHLDRLKDDHASATELAAGLESLADVRLETVETNIVIFQGNAAAEAVVARARDRDVLIGPVGPTTLRAVTHLDAPEARMRWAAEQLAAALESS